MYSIEVIGSVRGTDEGMQREISDALYGLLKDKFGQHGLFEVFVTERQTKEPTEYGNTQATTND